MLDVNVTIPSGLSLQADSFGFLQPLASSDSDVTFGLTLSNIRYTGDTLVAGTPTTPTAPSGLAATAGAAQVSLTWVDNSNNETGFTIERKIGAGSYATLITLAAGVSSYVDTGLTAGTTYTYHVKALNASRIEFVQQRSLRGAHIDRDGSRRALRARCHAIFRSGESVVDGQFQQ